LFLNIRLLVGDNEIMKTLKRLTFISLSLLLLQGCMPDSLTKFKEEAPKKKDQSGATGSGSDTGTGSGSGSGTDTPSCITGVDPQCTKPGTFRYAADDVKGVLPNNSVTTLDIDLARPVWDTEVTGHQAFIAYGAVPVPLTAVTSFNDEEGIFSGSAVGFLPFTRFTVSAKYSSPDFFTDAETPTVYSTIAYTFAHDLQTGDVIYPQLSGQKIILTLDDVTSFTAGNSISTADGAIGTVDYVDTTNKEVHVSIATNLTAAFKGTDDVDNLGTFFAKKASISNVYYAFDTASLFPAGFKASIINSVFTDDEKRSIQYSINPPLPTGLNLNQFTGEFGSSFAEQIIEGQVSTAVNSRTVTGINTKFSSQLVVGDIVTLNTGSFESAVVRSIVSDTELEVYTPFENAALAVNLRRRLAGSVSTTGGASTIVSGSGSKFNTTPKVILNSACAYCTIFINDVDTTGTVSTIFSDSSIQLNLVPAATPVITELTPTDYSISARNILGNSISIDLHLGILSNPTPKTISSVAYVQETQQRLKITVADAVPYTVGGYVSNAAGAVAKILFKAGNDLYIEIDASSNKAAVFKNNDSVDNNIVFFSGESTIGTEVVYSFPIDTIIDPASAGVGLTTLIDPTQVALGDAEEATLEYTITPNISTSNANYIAINSQLNMYKHSVCIPSGDSFPACNAGALCLVPLAVDKATCTGGGNKWVTGGTIFGTPSTVIADTSYKVRVTNTLGRFAESDFKMGFQRAPQGLAYSRNVLLQVPSASAFRVGDAITTATGAEGTVLYTDTRGVQGGNRPGTTIPEWAVIEVRVIKGVFKEFDDLDNHPTYSAQKTYVLGGGVKKYNTKLTLASTAGFRDSDYTLFTENENEITVGGTVKGRVVFNDEANNFLYVMANNNAVTETIIGNPSGTKIIDTIQTGNTVTASNITGTPNSTVSALESNNVYIQSVANFANLNAGLNVTTSTGVGIINRIIDQNQFFVSVSSGLFNTGVNIDYSNPFPGAGPYDSTTASIAHEHSFYFYEGEEGRIELDLDSGESDIVFTLDKALPPGLTFNPTDFSISGTPTDAASIEVFTLTATNPFGAVTYTFNIKVYEHYSIEVETTGFTAASYIMHREGQGHGRSPCRITAEQMATGASTGITSKVNDMVCYLEAGETELYEKGAKLKLTFGDNMCQFVSHKPYMGFIEAPGASAGAVFTHLGTAKDTCGKPNFSTDALGAVPVADAASQCTFNREISSVQYQCDTGNVSITNVTWTQPAFECHNNAGVVVPGVTTGAACVRDQGTCSVTACGGGTDPCTNYDDCSGATGVWTYNGFHNDSSYGGEGSDDGSGAAATWGQTQARSQSVGSLTLNNVCQSTTAAGTAHECGGSIANCAVGPGKDLISAQDIDDGVRGQIYTMSSSSLDLEIKAPRDLNQNSNYAIANYTSDTTCRIDDYTFDYTNYNNYSQVANISNNFYAGGSTAYTYSCDNGAGTPKALIKLIIRDWDKEFRVSDEIDKFMPGLGPAVNGIMDSTGSTLGFADNALGDLDNAKTVNGFCAPGGETFDFPGTNTNFPGDSL